MYSDRDELLAKLGQDPDAFAQASEELRADREVVLRAVQAKWTNFEHASPKLRYDTEIVLAAWAQNSDAVEFTDIDPYDDQVLIEAALAPAMRALGCNYEELRTNCTCALGAVQASPWLLRTNILDEDLRSDRQFIEGLLALKDSIGTKTITYFIHLGDVDPAHWADKSFVLQLVTASKTAQNWWSEEYLDYLIDFDWIAELIDLSIWSDKSFVLALMETRGRELINSKALFLIDKRFWSDKSFLLRAVHLGEDDTDYPIPDDLATDREFALQLVRLNGKLLRKLSPELRSDPEVVLAAVHSDREGHRHQVFGYASDELKNDRAVVRAALTIDSWSLGSVSKALRGDREIVLAAVSRGGWALADASEELRADREVVLAAVSNMQGYALQFASEQLRGDPEVVMAALNTRAEHCATALAREDWDDSERYDVLMEPTGGLLQYVSDALWSNRQFVLMAVTKHEDAFRLLSYKLRADREMVLAAVAKDGGAPTLAGDDLRADREVVLAAVVQDIGALEYASAEPSDDLRADRALVLQGAVQSGRNFRAFSDDLRADRDIVLAAVAYDGAALEHASAELRADREVVLTAIQSDRHAIEFANPVLLADRAFILAVAAVTWWHNSIYSGFFALIDSRFRADREVALAAVAKDGLALGEVSDELRADREVVLAALKQNGDALRFASDAFRADREMVMIAVNTTPSGDALSYASLELRDDREVVQVAVRRHREALRNASPRLLMTDLDLFR